MFQIQFENGIGTWQVYWLLISKDYLKLLYVKYDISLNSIK